MAQGSEDPQRKVEKWLEKIMDSNTGLDRLVLEHVGINGNQQVWDLDHFEGLGPENVAAQVLERANDDAHAQKGTVRYKLVAFQGGSRHGSQRTWFTLAGGGFDLDGMEDTEGPNGPGIIAQLMRHNEAFMRGAMLQTREIIVDLRRELADQRQMNRHMLHNQFKVVEAHERLLNEQTRREIEMRKAKFDEVKQEKIFEQIMVLLPVALRHMADASGSHAFKESALEQSLRSLIGTLRPEQLQGIMKNLNEAQVISFMDLYKSLANTHPQTVEDAIKDKEAREKAAAEKAAAEKAVAEAQKEKPA